MKINSAYSKKGTVQEMKEFFESQGFLQLNNFFQDDMYKIVDLFKKIGFDEKYNPLVEKCRVYRKKAGDPIEIIQLEEYFKSKEFLELIEDITDYSLQLKSVRCVSFSHKDFELLSDSKERSDKIAVIFDITPVWKEDWGGILTYTTREEEVLYLEPMFNTLTIVSSPLEIMRYVKYVNNKAKDKKILRVELEFDFAEEN